MRAVLVPGRATFLPSLANTVMAARAHGLIALDGVCNEFRDLAAFRAEAMQGAALGFDGKSLIHPDQIDDANAAYSPSREALASARALIAAFDDPDNAGRGAIRHDGKMAELLHRDEALRLVAFAGQIGMTD